VRAQDSEAEEVVPIARPAAWIDSFPSGPHRAASDFRVDDPRMNFDTKTEQLSSEAYAISLSDEAVSSLGVPQA
jgi:hypothetical protein